MEVLQFTKNRYDELVKISRRSEGNPFPFRYVVSVGNREPYAGKDINKAFEVYHREIKK